MLTTIALCLAPFVQGAAALHPAEAEVFVEIPDVQALGRAWSESVLPSMLADDALAEALSLAGAPDLSDLTALGAQLPPDVRRELLPLLHGVASISLSVKVDLATLESIVAETAVRYRVSQQVESLTWAVLFATDEEGNLPTSLASVDLTPEERLDPFGNPYVYTVEGDMFLVTCLGADGKPGGSGFAADWDSNDPFEPFAMAQLWRLVELELVVEWNDPAIAKHVADMAGMLLERLVDNLPFAEVVDLGVEGAYVAKTVRLDPAAGGVGGDPAAIHCAFQGDATRGVVSLGKVRGRDVADRIASADAGEVHASSLASDSAYRAAMARVQGEGGPVLWQGHLRAFDGASLDATLALNLTGTSVPLVEEMLDGVRTFLGFADFGGGAWQTRLVDGRYVSDSFTVATQSPGDLSAVAALVPNDAVWFELFKIDPLGAWNFLDGLMRPEDAAALAAMEEQLGFQVREDLLENLGTEFGLWFLPVAGLAPPAAIAVVPVRDGEAVKRALDALADFSIQIRPDFTVSRRPYKGIDYTALDVGIPIGLRPSYAVFDGMLWMSNSSTLLKRLIREREKGGDLERGAHPGLASLRQADGSLSSTLESVSYFDLGSILATYYGAGRSLAGMIPPDMGIPPDLIGALPEPDFFTRNIAPSVGHTSFADGALVTHKEGAFGPEPLLLAAAIAAIAVPRIEEVMAPKAFRPEVLDDDSPSFEPASDTTQVGLSLLEVGLLVYSIENGDYPTDLHSLLAPTPAYPGGFLGSVSLPLDDWGRAFHFERLSTDSYRLYSLGPDGLDQGGEGDDVASN